MLFSSAEFLFLFLPAVLLLYYLVKPWRAVQNAVLLVGRAGGVRGCAGSAFSGVGGLCGQRFLQSVYLFEFLTESAPEGCGLARRNRNIGEDSRRPQASAACGVRN